MGQKIHPLGFRLGTTQSHDSIWFAQPRIYSENVKEDKIIRDCIKNYLQKIRTAVDGQGIGRIKIQKRIDRIHVIINMGLPNLLMEDNPEIIEELHTNVQKKINCVNREINIAITTIPNVYRDPNILAEFIAGQLKNRIPFRKAMKKAIELAEEAGTKGVQIQIAGRIDGKEIARVEWIREGRVPLQTIRAKIDYCSYPVRTIYGVLGIKVWIFINND
jgi:small subunit ribosomal protein S3|uniref:Small ribosomal subunit protein uS3c n=1 Tax=Vicia sativa TaxID=3908 RepID=A0A0F6NLV0_VICSA|nr:ribosomal protein S3 [Vicia sativa]AIL56290.1 ribosomal protein S3 [Vicia sativa]AMM06286.1 ribosomal protein S3 [Vicia sativa]